MKMFSLGNYSIKLRLYALMIMSTVGLAAVLALALYALSTYRVNGPVYDELMATKNLENDVSPPALYASELYVTLQEMESATGPEAQELRARFERQVDAWRKKRSEWDAKLPEGEVKRKLETDVYPPAERFIAV